MKPESKKLQHSECTKECMRTHNNFAMCKKQLDNFNLIDEEEYKNHWKQFKDLEIDLR